MKPSGLLQIDKSEACLGMFIHGFGKQWLNSPFASNQFKLTDPADLRTLQASPVRTLVIDLSKGVGPAKAAAAPQRPQVDPVTRQIAAALTQTTSAVRSIFAGAASRAGIQLRQVDAIVDVIDGLTSARPTTVLSLNRLKSKDEISFQHSVSVCALVGHFSKHLRIEPKLARSLCIAGLLHDIGKVQIPDAILKKTEALTDDEKAVMQTHPQRGCELLAKQGELPDLVREVCLHHHERLDGTGYPNGLAGDQISRAVRIVMICDVYDAMTTVRPYKKGWLPEIACRKMAESPGQFDPELLSAFFACIGLAPPEAGAAAMSQ